MNNIKQFIKFGLVGISNTIISLGVYYLLVYCNVNYIISNTIGFIVSVLNSYYLNNKYVFSKTHIGNIKSLIKTFVAYGITFLLSTTMLFILVNNLNVSKLIGPIICLIITIPINFLINKFWAFK